MNIINNLFIKVSGIHDSLDIHIRFHIGLYIELDNIHYSQ